MPDAAAGDDLTLFATAGVRHLLSMVSIDRYNKSHNQSYWSLDGA